MGGCPAEAGRSTTANRLRARIPWTHAGENYEAIGGIVLEAMGALLMHPVRAVVGLPAR